VLCAALGGPQTNLAEVDNAVEALLGACYYLSAERNRYRFSLSPNINKLLTDRRAAVKSAEIDERLRKEIETCFRQGPKELDLDRRCFPTRSNDVPDRPALTLVALGPDMPGDGAAAKRLIESIVRECGTSGRTFKSALLFSAPVSTSGMVDQARDVLAWEDIDDDEETKRRMDGAQRRMLDQKLGRAKSDLKEAIWRAYRLLFMLGKDNAIRQIDFGSITSSMAGSLVEMIVNRLVKDDEISPGVGSNQLLKHWPPACPEWSTKAVRDAFYSSPLFPRLLRPDSIKRTIADGVSQGLFGYGRRNADGQFVMERVEQGMAEEEVEIADDVFLTKERISPPAPKPPVRIEIRPKEAEVGVVGGCQFAIAGFDADGRAVAVGNAKWETTGGRIDDEGRFEAGKKTGVYSVKAIVGALSDEAKVTVSDIAPPPPPPGKKTIQWSGTVPPQKWMNLYTRVFSPLVNKANLRLEVSMEAECEGQAAQEQLERIRVALRELGLDENVTLR